MKRVYYTWDQWECYPAGLYESKPPKGMTPEQAREEYTAFLRSPERFRAGLEKISAEWQHSMEHYLTNERMNRIAWLGQAAMCAMTGVPAIYRSGFARLTDDEQAAANLLALEYLNRFLVARGELPLTIDQAVSHTHADLY